MRRCAYTKCPTILSMYNDNTFCFAHIHKGQAEHDRKRDDEVHKMRDKERDKARNRARENKIKRTKGMEILA